MKNKDRSKRKKFIIGCGIALGIIGVGGLLYLFHKENSLSFPEWLESASTDELNATYDTMKVEFNKTGFKPLGMESISTELGRRGAREWFEKHPPNTDPNFRWTDANRWDKD